MRWLRPVGAALLLVLPGTGTAAGQAASPGDPAPPSIDILADVPGATMDMKLEKTFLKIDVLLLTVRVDEAAADRVAALVERGGEYESGLEGEIVAAVRDAEEIVARIRFLRGIGLGRFLDGVEDDMEKAVEAGWIDEAQFERIRDGLPEWFSPLASRGIEDGDLLLYHVRGDTLRTTFVAADGGDPLIDQIDVGRGHVLTLLGGYYAPDTSFREDLIRSLWEPEEAR